MKSVEKVVYKDGAKETEKSLTREGKVHIFCTNGDEFEGTYEEDASGELVKEGYGKYTWASGSAYYGQYKNNKKHGKGKYLYANGAEYDGEWKDGIKHGHGTESFPNGDCFRGVWAQGQKNGPGVYEYSSGAVLTGTWVDGELVEGKWEFGDKRLSTRGIFAKLGKRLSAIGRASMRFSASRRPAKKRPLGVIISGAPASGKGTQCQFIKEKFGLIHLSTGDMLRAAVATGSELGLEAKALMESGRLVPDEIVIGAVKERLEQDDVKENGFLLDGFPRTQAQAQALEELGIKVDAFIMLDVPEDILVARVVGRRIDPETGNSYHVDFNPPPPEVEDRVIQRADDTEEKVKIRLKAFHANIASIKSYYSNVTTEIDGTQPKELVWHEIKSTLQTALTHKSSN